MKLISLAKKLALIINYITFPLVATVMYLLGYRARDFESNIKELLRKRPFWRKESKNGEWWVVKDKDGKKFYYRLMNSNFSTIPFITLDIYIRYNMKLRKHQLKKLLKARLYRVINYSFLFSFDLEKSDDEIKEMLRNEIKMLLDKSYIALNIEKKYVFGIPRQANIEQTVNIMTALKDSKLEEPYDVYKIDKVKYVAITGRKYNKKLLLLI